MHFLVTNPMAIRFISRITIPDTAIAGVLVTALMLSMQILHILMAQQEFTRFVIPFMILCSRVLILIVIQSLLIPVVLVHYPLLIPLTLLVISLLLLIPLQVCLEIWYGALAMALLHIPAIPITIIILREHTLYVSQQLILQQEIYCVLLVKQLLLAALQPVLLYFIPSLTLML